MYLVATKLQATKLQVTRCRSAPPTAPIAGGVATTAAAHAGRATADMTAPPISAPAPRRAVDTPLVRLAGLARVDGAAALAARATAARR